MDLEVVGAHADEAHRQRIAQQTKYECCVVTVVQEEEFLSDVHGRDYLEHADAHDFAHLAGNLVDDGANLLGSHLTNLVEVVGVGVKLLIALADGACHLEDVFGNLSLEVTVANRAVVPCGQELVIDFLRAGKLEEVEEVLDGLAHLGIGLGGSHVGDCLLELLDNGLVVVVDVDAVAFALSHLAAAIEAGNLDGFALGLVRMWLYKEIDLVEMVETNGEVARHLEMLQLILAHRHEVCLVLKDVGSHEHGIGEQAGIDIVGILACLVLEGYGLLKFAQIGVHIEEGVEFAGLGNVALHINHALLGIHASSEVFGQNAANVGVEGCRIGSRGQRMVVGDEVTAVVVVLHVNKVAQCTIVVSEVKVSGGTDAAQDNGFLFHI